MAISGLTIGSSEGVRQAHNSFATPNPFMSDDKLASDKEDEAYHFIAYVPVGGVLYELDGLKPAPVGLCECTEVGPQNGWVVTFNHASTSEE